MTVEATKQRIDIIREKSQAGKRIADMKVVLRTLDKANYDKRLAMLEAMAGDEEEQQRENERLRSELPDLYKKLLYSPPSARFKEVNPLDSPNGSTFWRELDIEGLGRIDVSYQDDLADLPIPVSFAIEVGNLPDFDGQRRAKECILTAFTPETPLPGVADNLTSQNNALLAQHEILTSICSAAGI